MVLQLTPPSQLLVPIGVEWRYQEPPTNPQSALLEDGRKKIASKLKVSDRIPAMTQLEARPAGDLDGKIVAELERYKF